MVINELDPERRYLPIVEQKFGRQDISSAKDQSFTDSLKLLIKDVDTLQKDSASMTEKMIKGEPVDLHDVMISAEKAKTGFTLLMELRNKFLDLYREVSRLPV